MYYICNMEIWKTIIECDRYEVSNHGRIRRIKTGHLCIGNKTKGYRLFQSKGYRKMIHRIVGQYFIPNDMNKPYINHIDANRENNHYTNLEWVTPLENTLHGVYLGNIECKKIINTDTGEIYESKGVAALKFGVSGQVIKNMLKGTQKKRFPIAHL